MSCYHPLIGIDYGSVNTDTGKKNLRIVSGKDYDFLNIKEMYPGSTLIPCGRCIGCRLDYSRHWADRMMLELETQGKGVFVTLTYNDDSLVDKNGVSTSGYGSLYKRHFQLFMKKLRKEQAKYGRKIRYFAVGEYGSWKNTHRPHYHAILYGIGLDDLENKIPVGFNELRQSVYTSDTIARHWPYGFISVGDVSWRCCAYVARYVTKKALEPESDLLNESFDLNPMFSLMSRKPGIAGKYLEDHPDCFDNTKIFISTSEGSKEIYIPKYFVSKLQLIDSEKYDNIIAQRTLYAQDSMMNKLSQTDLPLIDYLEVEEKKTIDKIKSLRRSL